MGILFIVLLFLILYHLKEKNILQPFIELVYDIVLAFFPGEHIKEDNISYNSTSSKVFEFRPQTWEQFIGQTKAKEQSKLLIKKANMGIRCHALLSGLRGHGKTSLVHLIANYLEADMLEYLGKQVTENNIDEIVDRINASTSKHVILFIDEIDGMESDVVKMLNPMIEQYRFNGEDMRPFTLIGATINKHKLLENNPDTLDRMPTTIKMSRYSSEEIKEIMKQYHEQLYSECEITDEEINKLSNNCKFNPRTAISLLEDYVAMQDVDEVLEIRDIIKEGLTNADITILKTLNKSVKKDGEHRPLGANALALKSKLSPQEYAIEYEPFLVTFGYIDRTPSRIISDKGIEFLKSLNNLPRIVNV